MPNDDGPVSLLALLLNPTPEDCPFKLPPPELPGSILIDTARPAVRNEPVTANQVIVLARSVVLVLSKLERDR
jgi:glycogen operon protein